MVTSGEDDRNQCDEGINRAQRRRLCDAEDEMNIQATATAGSESEDEVEELGDGYDFDEVEVIVDPLCDSGELSPDPTDPTLVPQIPGFTDAAGMPASDAAGSEAHLHTYFDLGEQGHVLASLTDSAGMIGCVVRVPNSFWPGYTSGHSPAIVVARCIWPVRFRDGSSSRAYIIEAEGFHYPIKPAYLRSLPTCQQHRDTSQTATPAIGYRIDVYWAASACWQSGVVEAFDKRHLVRYDDGTVKWHNLLPDEFDGSHSLHGDAWCWRYEPFTGCFCQTEHNHPEKEEQEGLWVQCDTCSRWCHGECVGVSTKEQALALDPYVCPCCAQPT